MRKIIALCCLLGVLLLSACGPTGQPTSTTTTDTTTTDTTIMTDDTSWSDTDWSDDFQEPVISDWYDDDYTSDDDYSPAIEYVEVLPDVDDYALATPQTGGSDAEAAVLREEILNTKDQLGEITGVTYYVSAEHGNDNNDGLSPETAWQTCDALVINSYMIQSGDAILFERGGVYRRTSPIEVVSGVTYAAYGEGYKPRIYGSSTNYAWGTQWEPSRRQYVWKINLYSREAGMLVFNHGEAFGIPKYFGLNELQQNGDFYHNVDESILYLYLDKGYPNVVYEDIEIGTRENVFTIPDYTENVTFDNLCVKYAGLFTFDVQTATDGLRFTNLEIGWVGGCRYGDTAYGLGNGIQFWGDTYNALVENCWIYQIYDTGITPQGVTTEHTYKNLVFRKNLIEYCNYSIEVFDHKTSSKWDGLVIEDNIMRFAGYGWLSPRPDRSYSVSHYNGWTYLYDELPGDGITICNNIFDCSIQNLVYWTGTDYGTKGLTISGNSFYQKANAQNKALAFGTAGQQYATNQAELEAAVAIMDPNPKTVKWLS